MTVMFLGWCRSQTLKLDLSEIDMKPMIKILVIIIQCRARKTSGIIEISLASLNNFNLITKF